MSVYILGHICEYIYSVSVVRNLLLLQWSLCAAGSLFSSLENLGVKRETYPGGEKICNFNNLRKRSYSMSASILSAMVCSRLQSSVTSFSLSLLSPSVSFRDFFLFLFSVSSSCEQSYYNPSHVNRVITIHLRWTELYYNPSQVNRVITIHLSVTESIQSISCE